VSGSYKDGPLISPNLESRRTTGHGFKRFLRDRTTWRSAGDPWGFLPRFLPQQTPDNPLLWRLCPMGLNGAGESRDVRESVSALKERPLSG
jgi:hypothetical protein